MYVGAGFCDVMPASAIGPRLSYMTAHWLFICDSINNVYEQVEQVPPIHWDISTCSGTNGYSCHLNK